VPSATELPPTPTPAPSATAVPSVTPIPPTPTATPQPILLRRPCGGDYRVRADYPLQIFYGGWGVKGKDIADQWMTAITIDLTIDGEPIKGTLQLAKSDLPYNCKPNREADTFWVYSMVMIPGLSAGTHHVRVVFGALRPLSDGTVNYGTGQLFENTFSILAE